MDVRCAHCNALTRIETPASGTVPVAVPCRRCGRTCWLPADAGRGKRGPERSGPAGESSRPQPAGAANAAPGPQRILTADAVRPVTPVSHRLRDRTVFTVGGLILAGLVLHGYQALIEHLAQGGAPRLTPRLAAKAVRPSAGPPHSGASEAAPPRTVSRTDPTGEVVEVLGPGPGSVLQSFCATGPRAGRRQAVEIAPAMPPHPSLRLGIFRDLDEPGSPLHAIRIREDPRSSRWVAGNGRSPVPIEWPPVLHPVVGAGRTQPGEG